MAEQSGKTRQGFVDVWNAIETLAANQNKIYGHLTEHRTALVGMQSGSAKEPGSTTILAAIDSEAITAEMAAKKAEQEAVNVELARLDAEEAAEKEAARLREEKRQALKGTR